MKTATLPHVSSPPSLDLSTGPACDWHFETGWADSAADVEAAQALRFQVFAGELGARLGSAAMACERDVDRFDAFCDHLLVWACDGAGVQPRTLVGTYRVLPPEAARRAGGLYAEQEFDLSPLASLRPRMIELGRACVAPAWRSGGVILALWAALGKYMLRRELETMVGCASVGLLDGGGFAHALWQTLRASHLVAPHWQITPRVPLPPPTSATPAVPISLRAMPPLIKGYLRGRARLRCRLSHGRPAHHDAHAGALAPLPRPVSAAVNLPAAMVSEASAAPFRRQLPAVLAAQLATALGDNALLIVAIALLEQRQAPAWATPALRVAFYAAYVLLAPVAGRMAERLRKGSLMTAVNLLKGAGALALL